MKSSSWPLMQWSRCKLTHWEDICIIICSSVEKRETLKIEFPHVKKTIANRNQKFVQIPISYSNLKVVWIKIYNSNLLFFRSHYFYILVEITTLIKVLTNVKTPKKIPQLHQQLIVNCFIWISREMVYLLEIKYIWKYFSGFLAFFFSCLCSHLKPLERMFSKTG